MKTGPRRVAVVGAGWGGLAAAVALVQRGHAVSLYEAAAEPGGRARALELDGHRLDNGQHLLIGAYRETLAAMRSVGVVADRLLERRPLSLELEGQDRRVVLQVPRRGGRAALAAGLLRMAGIGRADRLRALALMHRLRRIPRVDGPAADWLRASGQPASLIRDLWSPLCLAALNAPAAQASARLFARVLRETFADRPSSDLLLPRCDLGALFPRPAVAWLEAAGQRVRLRHRVRELAPAGQRWRIDEAAAPFDDVILATGPLAAARLLPADERCEEPARRLRALGSAPIATVYLDCGTPRPLGGPMRGRLDGPAQWLFDRGETGQAGIVAAVISGRGPHEAMSRRALGRAVAEQLRTAVPGVGTPAVVGIVREKRATLDPRPGVEALRPGVAGPLPGLWHAGDHVATGLPATIEGAVRAGRACAAAIDTKGRQA